jgi:putative SOS response-associated peptidase YedK
MDVKTNILIPNFAMITLPPVKAIADIHDRMPAILERGDVKTWINSNLSGTERVAFLRRNPCPSENLKITIHKDHKE